MNYVKTENGCVAVFDAQNKRYTYETLFITKSLSPKIISLLKNKGCLSFEEIYKGLHPKKNCFVVLKPDLRKVLECMAENKTIIKTLKGYNVL